MTPLALRPATLADARALAHLHHQVWVETYAAMAPPHAVAALSEARRLATWTATLAAGDTSTLIALTDETPTAPVGPMPPFGLVCFGAATNPVFGPLPEIRHLYVLPGHRGQGHGLHLLNAALLALRAAGHAGAALAVVEDNHRARAFYRSAGGTEGVIFTDKGPLWRSRNRLVAWRFVPG